MRFDGASFKSPPPKGLLPLELVKRILAETEAATRDGVVYLTQDPETATVAHPRKEVDKWKALPADCVMWEPGRFLTYRLISTLKGYNGGLLPEGSGLSDIARFYASAPCQKKSATTDAHVPMIMKAFGIEGHPEITKAMRELMDTKPEKSIPFIRSRWVIGADECSPANPSEVPAAVLPDCEEGTPAFAGGLRQQTPVAAGKSFAVSARPAATRAVPPAVSPAWEALFVQRDGLNGEIDWYRGRIGLGGSNDTDANSFKACRSPHHFPTQLEIFLAEMDTYAREFLNSDGDHARFGRLHRDLSKLYTQITDMPDKGQHPRTRAALLGAGIVR